MTDNTPLPFDLPDVSRKKLTVDFEGGTQSSDAGLLLLREAERKLGVCRRLAAAMPDRRDPDRVDTTVVETNIHHPTDSTLLGDGVRVLIRTMMRIPGIATRHSD
jgi:Transposase DDE domain group 1